MRIFFVSGFFQNFDVDFWSLLKAEKVLPPSRFWQKIFLSSKFNFLSSIWIHKLLASRITQNISHCYTLINVFFKKFICIYLFTFSIFFFEFIFKLPICIAICPFLIPNIGIKEILQYRNNPLYKNFMIGWKSLHFSWLAKILKSRKVGYERHLLYFIIIRGNCFSIIKSLLLFYRSGIYGFYCKTFSIYGNDHILSYNINI